MDPVTLIVKLIDLGIISLTLAEATDRLRTGISAKAEKEGRDVNEDEKRLIRDMEAASDRAVRGE